MEILEDFINDVSNKNIFSYEHYKTLPLKEKIETINLLNEYYKLKYNIELPKITIYIDCDGVLLDTINYSKTLLLEQYGINYDTHDRNDVGADKKVGEFFKNLNWTRILQESPEINNSKNFIRLFKSSTLYNPVIYTSISTLSEKEAKETMFSRELKEVDLRFGEAKHPKECNDNRSILIDDDDFNLRYWNGIPVRFISNKPTIFPKITDLGEIYYLFSFNDQSRSFNIPNLYDDYEQVMCPKTKRLKWIKK